jgi:hypothetical protein
MVSVHRHTQRGKDFKHHVDQWFVSGTGGLREVGGELIHRASNNVLQDRISPLVSTQSLTSMANPI